MKTLAEEVNLLVWVKSANSLRYFFFCYGAHYLILAYTSFSEIENGEKKVKLFKQNKVCEVDRLVDFLTREKFKINSGNRRMDIQEFVDRYI